MGYFSRWFLVFAVSLTAVGAEARELQGFKNIKFGMYPLDLCEVEYIHRSICKVERDDDSPIDVFAAFGSQNLNGLTAFGYVVEDVLIYGAWRDGVRSIILQSGGNEDALVTAISESFGDPERWEEPKSDVGSKYPRDPADLIRVYFWEAENGTSILLELKEWSIDDSDTTRLANQMLAPKYHDGRARRELPTLQFHSNESTENRLRAAAKFRARSNQAADANDF